MRIQLLSDGSWALKYLSAQAADHVSQQHAIRIFDNFSNYLQFSGGSVNMNKELAFMKTLVMSGALHDRNRPKFVFAIWPDLAEKRSFLRGPLNASWYSNG
mmetsp:Transcript_11240/g.19743  ORF Transcript_11240/g.19743 Transcript_11240/m.19743 type:complete len:101 (+) Transcript_11240:825-1127(+)